MTISYLFASPDDASKFEQISSDVFDGVMLPASLRAFLADDRHHIAIAAECGQVIGFVSAVDYVHPDKPRELWINEVGVAESWQGKGVAKRLLSMMLDHGRALGCTEAWVLTEPENVAANALYKSAASERDAEPTPVIMHSFKLA